MLGKLQPLFALGGGGVLGSGKQGFSWVSLEDAVRAIEFVLEGSLAGVVNVCSPNPVDNRAFTAALGGALGRPTLFPLPEGPANLIFGQMVR